MACVDALNVSVVTVQANGHKMTANSAAQLAGSLTLENKVSALQLALSGYCDVQVLEHPACGTPFTMECFLQALVCCEWYRETLLASSTMVPCQVSLTSMHDSGIVP